MPLLNDKLLRLFLSFPRDDVDAFLFELSELDELDMEFSPQRWNAIVDHVTVHSDGRLVFNFQNGSDVIVEIV